MEEIKTEEMPKKPSLGGRISSRIKEYKRVLSVSRKPDKDDYKRSLKISGSGLMFLGVIGFVIFLLYFLIQSLTSGV